MGEVLIKRVYDAPEPSDGYRVLVDRLWPRGVSRDRASLDLWLKEIGPSLELRVWWGHDPSHLEAFAARYRAELDTNPALAELEDTRQQHHRITLIYAARDPLVNHARVLQAYLEDLEVPDVKVAN